MLEILRRIEKRGSLEKLRKVRQYCNQIFRYAIATGRATVNPASELTSTLAAPKAAHFHLRADELPVFLRKLAEYHGSPVTRMATNLLLLTVSEPLSYGPLNGQKLILIMPCGQSLKAA